MKEHRKSIKPKTEIACEILNYSENFSSVHTMFCKHGCNVGSNACNAGKWTWIEAALKINNSRWSPKSVFTQPISQPEREFLQMPGLPFPGICVKLWKVDLCLQGKGWLFYLFYFFFFPVITISTDCYIPTNHLNIKLLYLVIITVSVVITQNTQKLLYIHLISKELVLKLR